MGIYCDGGSGGAEAALSNEIAFSGGSPDEPGWQLIHVQVEAINGDKPQLLRKLNSFAADRSIGGNPVGFAYEIALAYNALGQPREALEWLARSEAAVGHSFNSSPSIPGCKIFAAKPHQVLLISDQ